MVDDRLMTRVKTDPKVQVLIPELEKNVGDGKLTPTLAVDKILAAFGM